MVDAYVDVGVQPDTSGTAPAFLAELRALEKRLGPVEIPVAFNVPPTALNSIRREVARDTKAKPITVAVKIGLTPAAINREVAAAAKTAKPLRVAVEVTPASLRTAANKTVAEVNRAKTVRPLRIAPEVRSASIVTAANKSVAEVNRAKTVRPLRIAVEVTPASITTAANKTVTEVNRAKTVRALRIAPEVRSADVAKVAGVAVTGARELVPALAIRTDVDTTVLVAQANAAVAAAQSATQTLNVGIAPSGGSVAAAGGMAAAAGGGGSGRGLMAAAAAGGALLPGAAMAAGFATSIDEASALAEAMSKVNAVFGESAAGIIDWSTTSTMAMGQAQTEALAAVGTMGNLMQAFGIDRGKAVDMSKTLTTLASDLASFNDTSVEDAITAITSGLSGETEPLKRFGVALSDVRLKEVALSKGLIKSTKEVLPPAVKAFAAYELIMQDTALAQGDFVRNGDGFANLSRTVSAEFTNLRAAVGAPMADGLLAIMPTLIDAVRELTPQLVAMSQTMADALGPAIESLLPLIGPLITMFGSLFVLAVNVVAGLGRGIAPAIPVITSLVESIDIAASRLSDILPLIGQVLVAFASFWAVTKVVKWVLSIGQAFGFLATTIKAVGAALIANPIGLVIGGLALALAAAYRWCEPFREAIDGIGRVLSENVGPAIQAVIGMFTSLIDGGFSGEFFGSFDNLKSSLGNIASVVPGLLADAGGALLTWFGTLGPVILSTLQSLLGSLGPMIGSALEAAAPIVASAASALWGWLGDSFAPALVGAVSAGWKWFADTGLPAIVAGLGELWGWVSDTIPGLVAALGDLVVIAFDWLVSTGLPQGMTLLSKAMSGVFKWLVTDGLLLVLKFGAWLITGALPLLIKVAWQIVKTLARMFGSLFANILPLLGAGIRLLIGWFAGPALTMLGQAILWLVNKVFDLLASLGDLGERIAGWISAAVGWLTENLPTLFSTVWEWFGNLATTVLNFITGGDGGPSLGERIGGWISDAASWLTSNLGTLFSTVTDWFAGLPGRILEAIGDLGETLLETGKSLMGGFWNGITAAASATGSFVSDIANAVIGFINEKIIGTLNSGIARVWPGWLPGGPPSIPEIPALAMGALVTSPTLALIGEAGPELVLPLGNPKRMAELLEQAGLVSSAVATMTSSAGAVAAPAPTLPDVSAVTGWASATVDAINVVPQRLNDETAPGVASFTKTIGSTLGTAGDRWAAIIGTAGGTMVRLFGATGDQMVSAAGSIGDRTAAALAGAVTGGVPTVIAAVRGYARGMAETLNPILTAVGSSPVALAFARGGFVPGPRVRRDVVPAMLMPHEVVIRRDSVDKFGKDALLDLNRGTVPRGWHIPGFAEGGEVTADAVSRGRAVAERAIGKPYVWGAVGPDGFDCSGLWSAIINAVQDRTPYRRLFTSASVIDNAAKIGMKPGLGQISIGSFKGNPGHVAGTIAGTNYEASPPRVRKGAQARGADNAIFTHRYHVGSGYWLEPGQSVDLPAVPRLGYGEIGRTAVEYMGHVSAAAKAFVDANTFVSDTSLADLMESGTSAASSSTLRSWIQTAMTLTGVPASWANGLYTIAMRESAGNPRAINLSDINARRGTPSKGLMQVIDPTFRRYQQPGYGNIWDPVSNIAAAINYIRARYGDISNVQQANPSARPRGYAEGGEVTADNIANAFATALAEHPMNVNAPINLPPVSDPDLMAQTLPRHLARRLGRKG